MGGKRRKKKKWSSRGARSKSTPSISEGNSKMSWLARALVTGFRSESKLVSVVNLRGMLAPPQRGPRKLLNEDRAKPW